MKKPKTAERTSYRVNEIFYSLQGEGHRQGEASIFVRFSGCNLQCDVEPGPLSPGGFACDTEFVSGRSLSRETLISEIGAASGKCSWVVFTGGEPLLQLDQELIDDLKQRNYQIALETNGTLPIPAELDWVVVSPKVAEHAIKAQYADELRYVRGYGQGIPKPRLEAQTWYLSPSFDGNRYDAAAVAWCISLVKENPTWRLSLQSHKLLGIR